MRPQLSIPFVLLWAAACSGNNMAGTSTGNPSPNEDAGPDSGGEDLDNDGFTGSEGGFCMAGEKSDIALDDDSQLGFSANDLLAFASGTHEEVMRWRMPMQGSIGPESGEGTITITLEPAGTAPRFVQPDDGSSSGGAEPAVDLIGGGCEAWLEVDVNVTVETGGGALDESFEAVLRSRTADVAYVYVSPEPGELNGSFEASYDTPGFNLVQLGLGITLTSFGTSGTFSGVFEMRSGDGATDGVATGAGGLFATFGRAACADGGFAVGPDDEIEGMTTAEVLALVDATDSVELTWDDGATATSTLAFEPDDNGGCVQLDNATIGDTTLLVYGTLRMQSDDGQLAGEWPGRIEARAVEGGSIRAEFAIQAKLPGVSEPGANAAYGFPMEDVTGFDSAGVLVTLKLESDAPATGEVALIGYTIPEECDTPPEDQDFDMGMGAPGCRGADPTDLARATF